MPGTWNYKYKKTFLVKTVHLDRKASPLKLKAFVKAFGFQAVLSDKNEKEENALAQNTVADDVFCRVQAALKKISAESRTMWYVVGAAIHSRWPNNKGRSLWDAWNKAAIEKFDKDDQEKTWKGFKSDSGIGIGNIFVSDYGNSRIQKFNSSRAYVTQWGSAGTGNGQFREPYEIAVDSIGNVYVADPTMAAF
jgi:hypothetical protein